MSFEAIIVNGGSARRFGGLAKYEQRVAGISLLGRVRAALVEADRVVLVGRGVGDIEVDAVVGDDPPGGGPVAGLVAGLTWLDDARTRGGDVVVTVAADLAFLSPAVVRALVQATAAHDVAVLVDADGREQLLVAAWRCDVLTRQLDSMFCVQNARISTLFAGVDVRRVTFQAHPPPWWDCDTPHDLEQARRWAEEGAL